MAVLPEARHRHLELAGDHRPTITIATSVETVYALLAARSAQQLYVDGDRVIQSFLRADLIDEMTACVAPVLIGSGLRLFGDGGMVHSSY